MREGPSRNRLAGAGSKPPSAALSKRQGRERGGKRPGIPGQVTGKKRTAREPLMKCRKYLDDVQNRGVIVAAGQAPTIPVYGRSGIRHERWPELAVRRLNGTWDPELRC